MSRRNASEAAAEQAATSAENSRIVSRLLVPMVYDELRAFARSLVARESRRFDVTGTDLVHEMILRLIRRSRLDLTDSQHCMAVIKHGIRHFLIDQHRRRQAIRHGEGATPISISFEDTPAPTDDGTSVSLNDAIRRLATQHQRASRVVELRVFGGRTLDETARVLGVSRKTAVENWAVARRFLARELQTNTPLGRRPFRGVDPSDRRRPVALP